MRRAFTVFIGFIPFLVGVTAAFLVLDVWLGRPDLGGSKLSVVMALGSAILFYEAADRVWGLVARRGTRAGAST